MCTVVIEVPDSPTGAVRVLAVRDEDPGRAWDPPGSWWPDRPSLVGVRDRAAGGAWLAAAPAAPRLALVLNRAGSSGPGVPEGPSPAGSRGTIVLRAASGEPLPDPPQTANFNLLTVAESVATVTVWDGASLTITDLTPGVHMIAHHGVDDAETTPRIERWLPEFRALSGLAADEWRSWWVELLAETTRLSVDDDRAIIRDNRSHGYPTLSLLVCLAEIPSAPKGLRGPADSSNALRLDTAVLEQPARWGLPKFTTLGSEGP